MATNCEYCKKRILNFDFYCPFCGGKNLNTFQKYEDLQAGLIARYNLVREQNCEILVTRFNSLDSRHADYGAYDRGIFLDKCFEFSNLFPDIDSMDEGNTTQFPLDPDGRPMTMKLPNPEIANEMLLKGYVWHHHSNHWILKDNALE